MNKIEHLFLNLKFYNQDRNFFNFYSALVKEVNYIKANHLMQVKTIYIATDDFLLLSNEKLINILILLQEFSTNKLVEYSFEIGYQTVTKEQLAILQQFKINRLVWRVRTFNNALLSQLNSKFISTEIIALIRSSKKLNYKNFSIDLEDNITNQTIKDIISDLSIALELKAPHISYQSSTSNHNIKNRKIINQFLEQYNYHNYEFFSFANKLANYSQQTIAYLTLKNWYGLGPEAASFIMKEEKSFIISNSASIPWKKKIKVLDDLEYYQLVLMQNLMLAKGFDITQYLLIKKQSFWVSIDKLIKTGSLELNNNYLRATNKGWLLLNQILVDIINNT